MESTEGCFELNIPMQFMNKCQKLKSGQMVELTGTNQKQGCKDADQFKIHAEKQGTLLAFSFHSHATGSVFKEKLSQLWKCHIHSIDTISPAYIRSEVAPAKDNPVSNSKTHNILRCTCMLAKSTSDTAGTVTVVKKEPSYTSGNNNCEENVDMFSADTIASDFGKINDGIDDGENNDALGGDSDVSEAGETPLGFEIPTEAELDLQPQETSVDATESIEQPVKKRKYVRKIASIEAAPTELEVQQKEDTANVEEPAKKKGDLRQLQRWRKPEEKPLDDLQCQYCERQWFKSYRAFHRHLNTCHENPVNAREETEEQRKLRLKNTCHICKMACAESNLRAHLAQAHNVVFGRPQGNVDNRCRYCDQTFNNKTALVRHRKFKCTLNPDRVKKVHCKYCGCHFDPKDLERHMQKKHPNGYNTMCDICGRVYHSASTLFSHRRRHLQSEATKKIVCSVCGKRFFDKSKMKIHMAVHSEEREQICEHCAKAFKTQKGLKKHVREVHENRYQFHCDKCGHGVAKKQYLIAHVCGRVRRVQKQQKDKEQQSVVVEPANSNDIDQHRSWFDMPEMENI